MPWRKAAKRAEEPATGGSGEEENAEGGMPFKVFFWGCGLRGVRE